MKTSAKSSTRTLSRVACFLSAAIITMGLSACEPEDELTPANNEAQSRHEQPVYYDESTLENLGYGLDNYNVLPPGDPGAVTLDPLTGAIIPASGSKANIQQPVNPDLFNVIIIDHQSARSRLPDYKVTVRSDGLVIFEGRNNVRIRERVSFPLTDITLPALVEIFDQGRFYGIVSDIVIRPDLPYVATTFQPALERRPVTKIDNYQDSPAALIGIRTMVEELLGIHKFVYYDLSHGAEAVVSPDNF
jgi:hypothetical protein